MGMYTLGLCFIKSVLQTYRLSCAWLYGAGWYFPIAYLYFRLVKVYILINCFHLASWHSP